MIIGPGPRRINRTKRSRRPGWVVDHPGRGPGFLGNVPDRSAPWEDGQARSRSTLGRRLAKSSRLWQASRAASRSAPTSRGRRGARRRAAGLATEAVMFVVSEESGQVAEPGLGPGGPRAAAVAVAHIAGPAARGRRGAVPSGPASAARNLRGLGVLAELVGVPHRDAARGENVRRSRSRGAGPGRARAPSLSGPGRLADFLEDRLVFPATCFMEIRPIPRLVAGVESPVHRRVLVDPGIVLDHDASTNPPSAAASRILGLDWVVVEKPTNFALPDFLIASAVSLNSWLFRPVDLGAIVDRQPRG